MKNKKFFLAVGVFGVIAMIGIAAFAYRNITAKPKAVITQTPNIQTSKVIEQAQSRGVEKTGSFQDADGFHKGSGTAEIVQTEDGPVLIFKNFKVTQGPDLFVYLSPNKDAAPVGEFVSLGALKSISGEQAYNLPDDYANYKSVAVWCRAFNVKFTSANLE